MAIDPRISLAATVAPQVNVAKIFNDIKHQQQGLEIGKQNIAMNEQNSQINQQSINQNRDKQRLVNIHQTGQRLKPFIDAGDAKGAELFLLNNLSQLQDRIEQGSGEDATETVETLEKVKAGNLQGVMSDITAVEGLVNQQQGQRASAGTQEFQNLLNVAQSPDSTEIERNAALIKLRVNPGASTSAAERIATDSTLGAAVADQEGAEARAKEGGKLESQRKALPKIRALVKLAEKEATERGDTLTALQRSKAALPGLTDSVNQLKELAQIATSTIGGKVFDFAVKQTGFGSTKGATARAKFIAIVNNQVLPLLKETFGAAFTATEGESLKATMGDPDASPEEKMAQLDAFIAQKVRDIQTKETQLDSSAADFAGFKVIR